MGEKTKLRLELKENDNTNRQRLNEVVEFYERQLTELRSNAGDKEKSLTVFYGNEIASLKEVIQLKQTEIDRLLALNKALKEN